MESETEAVAQSIQSAVSLRVLPGNDSVTCVSSCYLLQKGGESSCFLYSFLKVLSFIPDKLIVSVPESILPITSQTRLFFDCVA